MLLEVIIETEMSDADVDIHFDLDRMSCGNIVLVIAYLLQNAKIVKIKTANLIVWDRNGKKIDRRPINHQLKDKKVWQELVDYVDKIQGNKYE